MTDEDGAEGQAQAGVLQDRDFRFLLDSTSLSQIGQQISGLALPLVAVVSLTATEFEVGLLSAMSTVAFLLIGLPAGVWVDRLRYRRILIVSDLIRAVVLLTIPTAWWLGVLTVWQLYAVALVMGVFSVFFDVAYQSYLPRLIGRERLVEGNAKLETVHSVAQLGGPVAAGQLIAWLTAPVALAFDAVAMGLSALFVGCMRYQQPKPDAGARSPLAADIAEGLRFVLGNPLLRAIAGSTALFNLAFAAYMAMLVFFLPRDVGLGAQQIGIVFSLLGVGGLAGALATRRLTLWLGEGPAIWLSTATTAPFALLMPAAADGGWSVWLGASGLAVAGFGIVVYNVTQVSFRQRLTPDHLLGRMNATMRFLIWGTQPIGAVIGGFLGQLYGAEAALWIAGTVACMAFLPVVLSPLRRMRRLPDGHTAVATPPPA
ncbi:MULTISPECIES: MFS transporter [unclassified Arthrobacter]|uniref:MFS transporter n=1 Tax=unclassified Arthrobacter TaxID=235627 RepID=UPI001E2D5F4B|nr:MULTISPECIES: MFS transporter [unclassified Arthrobacter]MCC9144274.1 MFS transporter [Arthrobacter sp. zg-Y919]MDK1275499.1 MFS transporter [Arthrobacter sp. zg.Y919]WIB03126.1 MFS transporter [Arthrobacter sp. zg-Y919]